jgi:hypothetical protein
MLRSRSWKQGSQMLDSEIDVFEQRVSAEALATGLKPALLACLTSQESRRWTVAELCERLGNLGIPCPRAAVVGALGELALDVSLCSWAPWKLLEQQTEWILQPKTEILQLLSGIRRLPPFAAENFSDEHKAVLLVVIGHRRKGGVSRTRIEAILSLEATQYLADLSSRELVYLAPNTHQNRWRPTSTALLALGLRFYTEIPELRELENWFESQKTFTTASAKQANVEPLLQKARNTKRRKRRRTLQRRASAPKPLIESWQAPSRPPSPREADCCDTSATADVMLQNIDHTQGG